MVTIIFCESQAHGNRSIPHRADDDNICDECFIVIRCTRHDEYFILKAKHHLGENAENFAYGCPRCDRSASLVHLEE